MLEGTAVEKCVCVVGTQADDPCTRLRIGVTGCGAGGEGRDAKGKGERSHKGWGGGEGGGQYKGFFFFV